MVEKTNHGEIIEATGVEGATAAAKGTKNGGLANKIHPKTGVPFDGAGFPDFSKHLYKEGVNDVIIKPTGKRASDFAAANKAAGYVNSKRIYMAPSSKNWQNATS